MSSAARVTPDFAASPPKLFIEVFCMQRLFDALKDTLFEQGDEIFNNEIIIDLFFRFFTDMSYYFADKDYTKLEQIPHGNRRNLINLVATFWRTSAATVLFAHAQAILQKDDKKTESDIDDELEGLSTFLFGEIKKNHANCAEYMDKFKQFKE